MSAPDNAPALLLAGRRILIVEDEMIVAFDLSDIVEALGGRPVVVGRIEKAVTLAATEFFDAAILDLNLAGEAVYPVADELSRRGTPFVIASGYCADGISAAYRERALLSKPYARGDVEAALLSMMEKPRVPKVHTT